MRFRATVESSGKTATGIRVRMRSSRASGQDIELDTEPREATVPADLAAALERDADAGRTFDRLSYSQKQRHVFSIDGAKTADQPGPPGREPPGACLTKPGAPELGGTYSRTWR